MDRLNLQIDPPYREALAGLLSFSSFAETERTIKHLKNLCREYQFVSDKKGVEYCRRIASLGRRRAELISRNKRVSLQKRLQKQEIATWFQIWLETPAIFDDWLEMRKNTEEFRRLLESEDVRESKSGDLYASGNKKP
jgi:hypothetical protein